jgi:hypothetical protein
MTRNHVAANEFEDFNYEYIDQKLFQKKWVVRALIFFLH